MFAFSLIDGDRITIAFLLLIIFEFFRCAIFLRLFITLLNWIWNAPKWPLYNFDWIFSIYRRNIKSVRIAVYAYSKLEFNDNQQLNKSICYALLVDQLKLCIKVHSHCSSRQLNCTYSRGSRTIYIYIYGMHNVIVFIVDLSVQITLIFLYKILHNRRRVMLKKSDFHIVYLQSYTHAGYNSYFFFLKNSKSSLRLLVCIVLCTN